MELGAVRESDSAQGISCSLSLRRPLRRHRVGPKLRGSHYVNVRAVREAEAAAAAAQSSEQEMARRVQALEKELAAVRHANGRESAPGSDGKSAMH